MSQDTPPNVSPDPPERPSDATGPTRLEARVVRYDYAPDELTLTPEAVPEGQRVTTWISAQEGSFVTLEEMR